MRRLVLILFFIIPTVSALSTQSNFPKALDGPIAMSPALVDFDGDGLLEMIVTTETGKIHVLESNGSDVLGWPKTYSNGINPSSPAVGNLDDTGDPEAVVVFGIAKMSAESHITTWRSNGSTYWTYTISDDVTSSPALGDLDADGKLDVVVGSWDNKIYSIYYNGTLAWSYTTGASIYASPAMADLNSDGESEVLIPSTDGKLYTLWGNGSLYWSTSIGAAYYTAPAVGDIDFDGDLEIIIGSSSGLYALSDTGSVLTGWPRSDIKWGSPPALGDLNNNGKLEIVVGTHDSSGNKLYVLFENGSTKWSKSIGAEKIISQPAIADIDNDGAFDIVVATSGGTLYVYSGEGVELSSDSLGVSTPYSRSSSPALGDFDGDGDLEIMIGSYDNNTYGFDTPSTKKFIPWAMYLRDSKNSGFYNLPSIKITSPTNGSIFNKTDEVEFNGTAISPSGLGLTYEWYSDKDGTLGNGSNLTKGGLSSGVHIITLNVSDGSGNYGASYITISISTTLPTALIINPINGSIFNSGDTITFNGNASDSDGNITSYTWKANSTEIDSNSSVNSITVNSSFNYSTLTVGTHIINFTVIDSDGAQFEDTVTIRINALPTATIRFPIDGSTFTEGETITLNGTGSDSDGNIVSYNWTVDGNFLSNSSTINTSFSASGSKTITLTVTDDLGANGTATVQIAITASVVDGGGGEGTSGGGGGGTPSPITLISAGATELTSTIYSNILLSLSAGGKINKDRFVETTNTLAGPLLLTMRYPLPTDPIVAQFAQTVKKITGDVYGLAAEASKNNRFDFLQHENKLVIARGDLGVDSMAAVAYAKAKNIPILLVKPNELPFATENAFHRMIEIRRRDIIIIGGPVAVSEEVEQKLSKLGFVKRIYGETRIETAVALAEEAYPDKNKVRVIVITDYTNPKIDAVLMSYLLDAPLLYVKSDSLSPVVKDYISRHKETIFGPTKVMLMGVNPKIGLEINEALNL